MKTAIILHGAPGKEEYFNPHVPSASNHHWLPWIQKQLMLQGYVAHTPEVPDSWQPQYPVWKREFERYEITQRSLLVGHSCGGGFITRWLSENPDQVVDKVVLVAPWLDPWRYRTTDFFDFTIDPNLAQRAKNGFHIFNSDNDLEDVQQSAYKIRDEVQNCNFRQFHHYGHFCQENLGGIEFRELLDLLLS